jgi:4-hydroxybenzoate polyprenyltransferase
MSVWKPYAQLVRLPNLPTAMADIALGALATGMLITRWPAFLLLVASSCCLYMAGMVWNDFFDVEKDRKERPERPIPSGRVPRRKAGLLGIGLLASGIVFAFLAGWGMGPYDDNVSKTGPPVIACILAGAILLYDGWLKNTVLGPVAMGSCRFLNVLLGVSLSGSLAWPMGPHLALVVGLYIIGVTWFARTEVHVSSQRALAAATGVMLASLALGLCVPVYRPLDHSSIAFPYLLVAFGFWLAFPLIHAIRSPTPGNVQTGVKRSLIGLILLDTILATGTAGSIGLVMLVLMVPSLYLNRRAWLYAT